MHTAIRNPGGAAIATAATAATWWLAGAAAPALRRAHSTAAASPGRVRDVVQYPDPRLRGKCAAVANASAPEVRRIVSDLLASAHSQECFGCAAPQLGESARIFVVRKPLVRNHQESMARRVELLRKARSGQQREPPLPKTEFMACINPVLKAHGEETEIGLEACLSVPDYATLVRRYCVIDVEYIDADSGSLVSETLGGLPAIVFQHELDHLDGLLLTDRELRVFPVRSQEEEWSAAHERYLHGQMTYYGIVPSR